VVRREEDGRLDREEDDDQDEAENDREHAEVPAPDVVPDDAPPAAGALVFALGQTDARRGDVDVGRGVRHVASSGTVSGTPATFVGRPAVMACTISCCVVWSRS